MHIEYLQKNSLLTRLSEVRPASLDFAIVSTSALEPQPGPITRAILSRLADLLKDGAVLFVQGVPETLPEIGVYLNQYLTFKYWIAVESTLMRKTSGLPSAHAGVLLFAKGRRSFNIRRIRFPHRYCAHCNRTLKDWGGKSHLMHPGGYVISDVLKDLPKSNNYDYISLPLLETLLRLPDIDEREGHGVVAPLEGILFAEQQTDCPSRPTSALTLQKLQTAPSVNQLPRHLIDVVHCGDALGVLAKYPEASIDLAFADPPYNLEKAYNAYSDDKHDEAYVEWCKSWLREYIRLLKPTGSLYVLNLPKWSLWLADFLNRHLCFQNWIVWDGLSDPRGKLLPAHYALLFYTKQQTGFTFNYDAVGETDSPSFCLRRSCIRQRNRAGLNPKVPLTDIWSDIHRIKHKRDRDMHPCQLPDALMERIIQLSSNPGDVVLDTLCGAGTAPVAAVRLGRHYVAVDIDEQYVNITRRKIEELQRTGTISRASERRPRRKVTKKELQLELRDLALRLGRLPTPQDVAEKSKYDLDLFRELFATWGKALKAAKLEVQDEPPRAP